MASDERIVEVDGREVRITSPGKVFFPERGETKLDLVDHYLRVAEPLMRTMGGRPVLLQRFPEGAGGPSFFQKRVPKSAPPWLETTIVSTPNGTTSRALVAADVAHLLWAVNIGCLGFHPWPYLAADPGHTDELRLDLDPQPGTDFSHVQAAAAEVRTLLDDLGMVGYPKTTGNRGVHVYVRLEPRWDSYQVRFAAVAVARELERRRPDLITASWWKEERGERIFIDYNQNAPHKTVFGAWSVRARVGRAGVDAAALGRDRRDPPRRAHDREPARTARRGGRPVGGDQRRTAVARAAPRHARARPRQRAHGRPVAAGVPEAARRATPRRPEPRPQVRRHLTPTDAERRAQPSVISSTDRWGAGRFAIIAPSMEMAVPDTYDERSDARNSASSATSSARAEAPMGICAR